MRYCLLSRDDRHGYILDKLANEGHDTLLLSRTDSGAWGGMLDRAPNLNAVREWKPDVVVIDSPGFGPLAKTLSDEGIAVFGGNKLQDRLQDNYLFGLGVLEAAGVPTCDHSRFTSIEDAVDYSQGKDQAWAMRTTDGKLKNFPSTVGLQLHLEKLYQDNEVPNEFALQRGFPDVGEGGIHLNPMYYLCGLYNEVGLMQPCFKMSTAHNLLPDGMGVPTYEGVTLQPLSITDPDVVKTLAHIQPTLKTVKYTGWVWIGVCSDYDKKSQDYTTRALDFRVTPPDGFWAALLGGLRMSAHYFFDRVLNPRKGNVNTPFDFSPGYTASRKLSLPPYPMTEAHWLNPGQQSGMRGFTPDVCVTRNSNVYWCDVCKHEDEVRTCGPVLGYGVSSGDSSSDALRGVSKLVSSLAIPYLQVKVEDGMGELHLDICSPAGRII